MDKRKISLLGSTGSIGRQTLEVAALLGLPVRALTAGSNTSLLERQARQFKPALVAVFDEHGARDLRTRLQDTDIAVASGPQGLIEAATATDAQVVVTAVVGTVGLKPTLAAIDAGRDIALANKETLVCAGAQVMKRARDKGVQILPVDSEHSAIFQCLQGNPDKTLKRILLTASGGPFRGKTAAELTHVTLRDALAHPNWSMGQKITVDSATLMNKGLEFIEAMHLYGVAQEAIEVLVHPQSIIHSMVEFADNSVLAQLSVPDMRLPIQYALTYPQRLPSLTPPLDLLKQGALTFEAPDLLTFPCLKLAMDTARSPGTACAVMNAANEAAVDLFLREKISFRGIYDCIVQAMERIKNEEDPTIDQILAADQEARHVVASLV